ncbi:MAG TPA: hypothetical protein VFF41_08205 [Gallionella sp.]|nr:hypothetical protein [Gallionella sp.]
MLNIVISTIVFFIAAWYINRQLDEQEINRGMTRGVLVFFLASLVSWGAGEIVDWTEVKIEGPQAASTLPTDLSQVLKLVGQR